MQFPSANSKHSPRRLHWLIAGTALLVAAIAGANALILAQLHRSTLREVQDNLLRQSLDLSELTQRALQAADLVLISIADKVSTIAAAPQDTKALESRDVHDLLAEKISGLPQLHTLAILDRDGNRLNTSLAWPTPQGNYAGREYFRALKNNPNSAPSLDAPVRGAMTGSWVIIIARSAADEGSQVHRRGLRRDRHRIIPRHIPRHIAGQRLRGHAAARGRHAAGALSGRRRHRNQGAGVGAG